MTGRTDIAYWRNLARCVIANPSPELIEKIAADCVQTERDGGNAVVWHSMSVVTDSLDRCPCARCRRARGEKGPSPYRYHQVA